MSFNIMLQNNGSDNNVLTKKLNDLATVTGTLRNSTSIIDPVIIISKDITDIPGFNYFSIPKFSRSYFVKNIVSARNGVTEIHGHVDVLSSFNGEIRANKAIIKKQEKVWNLYINDGTFNITQKPKVLTKAFPSGFTGTDLVLAVAGG